MKILEVVSARSIWLFDTIELNPRGVSGAALYKTLMQRYNFLVYPNHPENFTGNTGLDFNEGTFPIPGKSPLWVRLQIFNDGVIADTRSSTDDTDAFLEEILQTAKTEFGLNYHPGLIKAKNYFSSLTVVPDFELTKVCTKFEAFSKVLAEYSPAATADPEYLVGIIFKPNANTTTPNTFTFERREKVPLADNKYFSNAALPTERHIKLLSEFEQTMIR